MANKKPKSVFDLQDILKRFDDYQDFWDEPYQRGKEDTSFVMGEQWPSKIKAQRDKENRPCLTDNRMLPFVNQVVNSIRQARPSIIPKPVDDKADVQTAEILRGLIRNIEVTSKANTVYDTAARNSVMSSVGWIRVVTQYAGNDTFDQEVKLKRIQNPASVMLDPNHEEQDGSDAVDGFVSEDISIELFEELYPEADQTEFKGSSGWKADKTIRVAEYFKKVYTKQTLCEYEVVSLAGTVRGIAIKAKVPLGARIIRERESQTCKVHYCKVAGCGILEEGVFPGEYIPLVPIYGFEVYLDDRRTFFSLIHQAKDGQRMLNYWKSASAEIVALQPKAPYVGAVGQFKSYTKQWASANVSNLPFLEYDPVTVEGEGGQSMVLPPPQRQAPPTSSGTLMEEAAMAADSIKASLGMFDASLGAQSADISGKAIISRQLQGDNATFHFVDNLSVGIEHVGRICIGIIPIIYTGQRIIRILGEDGKESLVPLNRPVVQQGKEYVAVNENEPVADPNVSRVISFDAGKYDVVVEVGASYATKRQELANAITEIARVNPDIMGVAGDLFMKSLDVPYAEEIAKRIRATMPPALLGDDVDAARLQELTGKLAETEQKLALTEQALLAKQTNDEFKNALEAKKVENDTKQLEITAAKAMAEIQKIQSEIAGNDNSPLAAVAATLTDLQARQDDITGALEVLLAAQEEEGTGAPITPEEESMTYAGRSDIASAA